MLTEEQLKTAIAERREVIKQLERGLYPDNIQPRSYVVEVINKNVNAIGGVTTPTGLNERSMGSVVLRSATMVDRNTIFYAKSIQCSVVVQGSLVAFLATPAGPGNMALPGKVRLGPIEAAAAPTGNQFPTVNFWWKVRDTGSDREWQDDWLPAALLQSGDCLPLEAGRAHGTVSGGSELEVLVQPVFFGSAGLDDFVDTIQSWSMQFAFHGEERRL